MIYRNIRRLWRDESNSGRWAIGISIIGGLIFIIAIGWFVWSVQFNFFAKLDPELVAHAGGFIGGVVGSLWALAGVLLVYAALQAQRKDFTRQKFETSFFQLLNFRMNSLDSLSLTIGRSDKSISGYKVLEKVYKIVLENFDAFSLNHATKISFSEYRIVDSEYISPNSAQQASNYLEEILKTVLSKNESSFIHFYRYTNQAILYASKANDIEDRKLYLETIVNSMPPSAMGLFVFISLIKEKMFSNALFKLKEHELLNLEQLSSDFEHLFFIEEILKTYIEDLSYN